MSEFPTYEQMAKNVADKALDEILYDGKSIREWMKIIAEQEPCGDCISREKVIDILDYWYDSDSDGYIQAAKSINELPSVNPKEPKTVHWAQVNEFFINTGEMTCQE